MKSLIHLLLIVGSVAHACAFSDDSNAEEPSARIVEYGRYDVTVTTLQPTKGVSGSVSVNWKDAKHIETTRDIPRRVGESWGLRLDYRNLPQGRAYEFRTETHHPPITQPDGRILRKAVTKETIKVNAKPRTLILSWFFLEGFEYELVRGKWTEKIFVDGVEVAKLTFVVKE